MITINLILIISKERFYFHKKISIYFEMYEEECYVIVDVSTIG